MEGEGCFTISIGKSRSTMPFEIRPQFIINMKVENKELLSKIAKEMDLGYLLQVSKPKSQKYENVDNTISYSVSGLKECLVLINFFDKCEFFGKKKQDYLLWKQAIEIIKNGKRRTKEGVLEIAKIRDKMNRTGVIRIKSKRYRNFNWFVDYLSKN